ncbi:MAG TPA: heme o synthase [Fimbriimonadales bacterium]|nr:heme o synthase [Fimbriimonadales bacterium]
MPEADSTLVERERGFVSSDYLEQSCEVVANRGTTAPAEILERGKRHLFLSKISDYLALSKPRVTLLVWLSTAAGIILAGGASGSIVFHTLLGSWLVIAAANALNQVLEVEPDSRMERTRNRPLPAKRLSIKEATWVAGIWAVIGLLELAWFANLLTALLGFVSIILYAFLYTPLKRKTHACTVIGAIPGAIPPLAGWVAVRGSIDPFALALFGVQFLWQFPHFWSIAWLLREDYEKAGFRMLPFPNASGEQTGLCASLYAFGMFVMSLSLVFFVQNSWIYFLGVCLIGAWIFAQSVCFWRIPDSHHARQLLKATVQYLPLFLILTILTLY